MLNTAAENSQFIACSRLCLWPLFLFLAKMANGTWMSMGDG